LVGLFGSVSISSKASFEHEKDKTAIRNSCIINL